MHVPYICHVLHCLECNKVAPVAVPGHRRRDVLVLARRPAPGAIVPAQRRLMHLAGNASVPIRVLVRDNLR